jgi:cation diffusion facilitator CzcD-associated flavoprotein CzcO
MDTAIVVGAGPAGLAAAAQLRRAQIPTVVLEQGETIAPAWRARYDRLRLNSARWYSKLPDGPAYPPGTETFPSRDDVVGYLDAYAEHHRLDVRLGVKVEHIEREGERWRLETSDGEMHAVQVVYAGGYEHRPFIPAWVGRTRFKGTVIHTAGYREASPFKDEDVLVVGPGCSGAEVAYDLVEGGAARVRLAVRTPPNIIIRAPAGAQLAAVFMKLPPSVGDAVMRFVRRKTIGDLSEFGLPVPDEGVFSRLRRLHVAPMIVNAEVIEAIRDRRIEIVGAVEGFDETGVLLADGARIEPDAVIAATGYRTGLEPVVGHLDVLDDHGVPRVLEGEAAPGLRFVGYDSRPAQLRYGGRIAKRAARAIARESKRGRGGRPLPSAQRAGAG